MTDYRIPPRDEDRDRATPHDVRKAWEAAGIDLDELKRTYDRYRSTGPMSVRDAMRESEAEKARRKR